MPDALSVVRDYLRVDDWRIRANAATALAALDDERAIRDLVGLAVGDPSQEVRDRAEEELVALEDPEILRAARAGLKERIDGSPEGRRAYVLIGRLHGSGRELGVAWGRRIRFALALWRQDLGNSPGRRTLVGAVWGVLGSVAAALILGALLAGMLDMEPDMAVLGLALMVLAPGLILGAAVSGLSSPVGRAPDLTAMLLVQILALLGLGAGVGVIVGAFILMDGGPSTSYLPIVAIIAVLPAACRLGTVAAHFMAPPKLWDVPMRLVAGSGAVMGSASLWLVMRGDNTSLDQVLWMLALPTAFGLAAAYTWIDRRAPARVRARSTAARAAALALASPWLLLPISGLANAASDRVTFRLPDDRLVAFDTTVMVDRSPATVALPDRGVYLLTAEILDEDHTQGRDYAIELNRGSERRIAWGDDPPGLSWEIRGAGYELDMGRWRDLTGSDTPGVAAVRLSASAATHLLGDGGGAAAAEYRVRLTFEFGEPTAQPVSRRMPQPLDTLPLPVGSGPP